MVKKDLIDTMKRLLEKIPTRDLTWILRIWLGSMMIYHSYWAFFDEGGLTGFAGYLVKNGFPESLSFGLAILSKGIEFFGGIVLLSGLATRLASLLVALIMGVAVFYLHKGLIWSEGELATNYLIIAIILFFSPIKKMKHEK